MTSQIGDWIEFQEGALPAEPPRASEQIQVLSNQTTRRVLMRYVMDDIPRDQLVLWAATIRQRSDVEPELQYAGLIKEVLRQIATDPTFDSSQAHTCVDRLDWAQT